MRRDGAACAAALAARSAPDTAGDYHTIVGYARDAFAYVSLFKVTALNNQ